MTRLLICWIGSIEAIQFWKTGVEVTVQQVISLSGCVVEDIPVGVHGKHQIVLVPDHGLQPGFAQEHHQDGGTVAEEDLGRIQIQVDRVLLGLLGGIEISQYPVQRNCHSLDGRMQFIHH